jgi:hypothetical protein
MGSKCLRFVSVAIYVLILVAQAASQDTAITSVTSTVNRLTSENSSGAVPSGSRTPVAPKGASTWGLSPSVPAESQRASNTISSKSDSKPVVVGIGNLGVDSRFSKVPASELSSSGKRRAPENTLSKKPFSARTSASTRSIGDLGQAPSRFAHPEKQDHTESAHLDLKTGISMHRSSRALTLKSNTAPENNEKLATDMKAKRSKTSLFEPKGEEGSKLRPPKQKKLTQTTGGTRGR